MRALPRAARLVLAADPVRQARDGTLRSGVARSTCRRSSSGWTTSGRSWMPSGRERAALFGIVGGRAACASLFAATYPERTARSSLYGDLREARSGATTTRGRRPREERAGRDRRRSSGTGAAEIGDSSAGAEPARRRAFKRRLVALPPRGARARARRSPSLRMNTEDRRPRRAAAIRVPTLVLHRSGRP